MWRYCAIEFYNAYQPPGQMIGQRVARSRFISLVIALFTLFLALPASAGETLSQATAMAAVENTRPGQTFAWRTIQIAGAKNASIGESSSMGLPYPVVVYPVRAEFTMTGGYKRDVVWNYYIYQDASGRWIAASNAIPGNSESQPY